MSQQAGLATGALPHMQVASCSASAARPSWLSLTAPNCHIALEIFVVPFSNAKVVGSFRMARLKRVPALKLKISPVFQIVNFAEVLLITEW